jgi:molybdopterin-guanine dinucleotide biosynthesis protein A
MQEVVQGCKSSSHLCDIPIVILCGGKSSRMQQDKTLLPFGAYETLTQFQYERLKKEFKTVFLSSKTNKFDFLPPHSCNIIYDNDKNNFSPLLALQSILEQACAPKVFILSADTPFVSIATMAKLVEKSKHYAITTAKTAQGKHPLCGVFSKEILPTIHKMLEDNIHKIGMLLQQTNSLEVLFENEKEFLNLNTPKEYEQALQIISQ